MGIYLSQDQINNFNHDGFLIIPDYLGDEEISALRQKAKKIVNDFDVSQVSVFSTVDQTKTSDQYFIDSGDKIRCFFEEESFDQEGQLVQDKMYAINKIGHALHDLDNDFHKASYKKDLAAIAQDIEMKNPLMVQSQYIFKQPKIGGKVVAIKTTLLSIPILPVVWDFGWPWKMLRWKMVACKEYRGPMAMERFSDDF